MGIEDSRHTVFKDIIGIINKMGDIDHSLGSSCSRRDRDYLDGV